MADIINPFTQRDAALVVSVKPKAAGTAGTTTSTAIDLGACDAPGIRTSDFEFLLEAPALTATHMATGATLALKVESSNASDFSTIATTQTLKSYAAGAASAENFRFKIAADAARYWRISLTTNASTGTGIGDQAFKFGPAF